MKYRINLLFTLLLIAYLTSCMNLMNRYNASGAEQGITNLLQRENISLKNLQCYMYSGSRSFYCFFTTTQSEEITQKYKLYPVNAETSERQYVYKNNDKGCLKEKNYKKTFYEAKGNRPKEIRGYEYLHLYLDKTNPNKACLQSSISYG